MTGKGRKRKIEQLRQKPIDEFVQLQYIPNPLADDSVSSFNKYVHRVFVGTLLLILVVAGTFLFVERMPWARGVALGGAASLVNLVIMAGDVRRQGPMVGDQGMSPAYGRYALRMALIAAVLIYSATSIKIAFWATVPALFTSQFIMTGGELLGEREQEPS
jgi:hypothetical protein